MAIEIRMPRLSQTTDEVRFLSWLVGEGDEVRRGDRLCEVETDKVTTEVESFAEGTVLRLLAEPDAVIDAGTVIALLGEKGEQVPEGYAAPGANGSIEGRPATRKHGAPESVMAQGTEEASRGGKPVGEDQLRIEPAARGHAGGIRATKLVQNLSRKRGIDLASVRGTGPRGLITKRDLEEHEKTREAATSHPPGAPQAAGAGTPGAETALSTHQRAVARSLSMSKREIPHYYLKTRIVVDALVRKREELRREDGSRLSVDSFFVHALARVLAEMPRMNGYFRDNKLVLHRGIHINAAIAAGEELYAPVVRDANRKSVEEIDRELRLLAAKARSGKLEPEDVTGGSFTLSNLGMYPVEEFVPIINPPQAGIVALGRMGRELVVEAGDTMRVRTLCTVTGSFDHRIVNGVQGAVFLQRLKTLMEEL
jgi:pyruvate dehydrogenase E2 component (dihydrolipoamide acetyltransferase)